MRHNRSMENFVQPALPPAPTIAPACDAPLPSCVRARLWLPGHVFGPNDDDPRLWLALADGRVLAFRLPEGAPGDDAVIAPLADFFSTPGPAAG